jgi:long-subunit fatty acid transport protein
MMRALWILLAVPLFCVSAFAQSGPDTPILTLGLYHGPGGRALGLGGAYTGVADDFTATYWNPAGLAQVKRIELQGSLLQTGFSNSSRYYVTPVDVTSNFTRLNNLGMVFPVPVYQGALSFAVGYNQVVDFGSRASFRDNSGIASVNQTQSWNQLETGRLGFWNFAGAMDVSQNVSLGLALCYWVGHDEFSVDENYWSSPTALTLEERLISTDLSGWGAIAGVMGKLGRWARMGLTIGTPITFKAQEEWSLASDSLSDNGYWDYQIRSPWMLRWGVSLSPGRWLLAADVDYKDWTQVEYRSEPPQAGYTRAEMNLLIRDTYRSTLGLHVGGEYLIPFYGMRARLGFGLEPAREQNAPSSEDRKILGLGLGILLDRSVLLDASYMHSWWNQRSDNLTEDIALNSVLLTLSYRF